MGTRVVKTIHLPIDDTHFEHHLEQGPLFEGRGTYQFNKIQAALLHVPRHRIAIDVGAHVGLWSIVLAHKFEMVHAFEPVPEHVECFKLNLPDFKNVKLHPVALGAISGSAYMETVPDNSGNAFVTRDRKGKQITITTLDLMVLPRQVDFIKIDVEGFEMAVVQGGESLIRMQRPVMVVEQKPGNAERQGSRTGAVITLLKQWGYKQAWVKSGDYCMVFDTHGR